MKAFFEVYKAPNGSTRAILWPEPSTAPTVARERKFGMISRYGAFGSTAMDFMANIVSANVGIVHVLGLRPFTCALVSFRTHRAFTIVMAPTSGSVYPSTDVGIVAHGRSTKLCGHDILPFFRGPFAGLCQRCTTRD